MENPNGIDSGPLFSVVKHDADGHGKMPKVLGVTNNEKNAFAFMRAYVEKKNEERRDKMALCDVCNPVLRKRARELEKQSDSSRRCHSCGKRKCSCPSDDESEEDVECEECPSLFERYDRTKSSGGKVESYSSRIWCLDVKKTKFI